MAPAPRKSSTRSAPAAGSMADIPRASAISSRSTTDGSDSAVNWIPAQRRDCDGRDDTMTNRHRMSPFHIALAVLVMAIWGTNFVVIKIGLRDFPPFLFALLRFFFSALPFAFFVRRPQVEWRWLVLYGVFLGAGQFGLLFYAMREDISPGLASLVVQ